MRGLDRFSELPSAGWGACWATWSVVQKGLRNSSLIARAGSTFAASRAGTHAAPAPTARRTSAIAANIPILHGFTPSGRMSVDGRMAATEKGKPVTTPQANTAMPSLMAVRRVVGEWRRWLHGSPFRSRRRVAWETEPYGLRKGSRHRDGPASPPDDAVQPRPVLAAGGPRVEASCPGREGIPARTLGQAGPPTLTARLTEDVLHFL